MPKRLLPALLAGSIALASSPSAATAPATGVLPKKVDHSPIAQRLRMRLEVISTTDDDDGVVGDNTEDEIYYAVSGLSYMQGADPQTKTIKRAGDRDIWEMGPSSAPTLHRTLFKGNSSPLRASTFILVVAEQDNKSFEVLEAILSFGVLALRKLALGEYHDESAADQVVAKAHGELEVMARRISFNKDQFIGAVMISMKGDRLKVETHAELHSKVIEAGPKQAVMELWGPGYKYELTLILEDGHTSAPVVHDFIGLEDDDCGGELWLDTKNGRVKLAKGNRVGFRPKSHEFEWFCDGDGNITRADPVTDYVIASRANSGREILWRIFKDYTPSQDLNW